MNQSITSDRPEKPQKPTADFPLYAHATRRWAKKVRGRTHFFGPWGDPTAALNRWLDEKDDLLAGRVPRSRAATNEPTLGDLVNRYLSSKTKRVESGELTAHTMRDYEDVCKSLVEELGEHRLLTDRRTEDFETLRGKWSMRWGKVRLGNQINMARMVFRHATKNGLLAREMLYGDGFQRPSKKTLRLERVERGPRMFQADEVRRMIRKAGLPLKAMVLLGVNCGLGNSDCGRLPLKALDLDGGWLNYPRPKTGINRRCKLWPETVRALKAWMKERPAPASPEFADLVFLTSCASMPGGSWAKDSSDNPISKASRKLLDRLGINGHRGFYGLRHTFETVGGNSRDQVAVDAIMGHVDDSMAASYRDAEHGVADERLVAVAEHVRTWLYAKATKATRR